MEVSPVTSSAVRDQVIHVHWESFFFSKKHKVALISYTAHSEYDMNMT